MWVIFALLDPDSDPDSESGSATLVYGTEICTVKNTIMKQEDCAVPYA